MQTPDDDEEMVKEGVVRAGETPSVVSGATSDCIKQGEAYTADEPEVDTIEDLADELD